MTLACLAAALAAGLAPARAAEPLRIAATRAPVSLALYVAEKLGYFRAEGVEVVIDDCVGGTRCLRRVYDGLDDLATSSEMPVVLHSFAADDIAVIATMVNASDNLKLIARRESGITRGAQLDRRRIGVIAGTAAQFQLEIHLLNLGIDPLRVTMVPIQPEETVDALRSARIDAVAVWEPFGYQALHGTGGAEPVGLRLPLTGGYIETYNLVAARRVAGTRDDALVRLLRAVDRAERAIGADPAQAQAILRERLHYDQAAVDWVWPGLAFRLGLDQSLLSTMESEARWAQREGHVAAGSRPNALALIHAAPLRAVRPSAVGTAN